MIDNVRVIERYKEFRMSRRHSQWKASLIAKESSLRRSVRKSAPGLCEQVATQDNLRTGPSDGTRRHQSVGPWPCAGRSAQRGYVGGCNPVGVCDDNRQ